MTINLTIVYTGIFSLLKMGGDYTFRENYGSFPTKITPLVERISYDFYP
jgi:hypothetical protein